MRQSIKDWSWAAFVVTLLVLTARADGPSFSGRYECSGVLRGDTTVSLTFTLWLINHRAEGVGGATVALIDSSQPDLLYAEFPSLSLEPGVDVQLETTVTLHREEWDRWMTGAPPRVRVTAFNPDGTEVSEMVDLVQLSAPEVLQ